MASVQSGMSDLKERGFVFAAASPVLGTDSGDHEHGYHVFARLMARSQADWDTNWTSPPFTLVWEKAVSFVTDMSGVDELLQYRSDAAGALRHVGWTDNTIRVVREQGRAVKLLAFLMPKTPMNAVPATWEHLLSVVLPAILATGADVVTERIPWSRDRAANVRFVSILQANRDLLAAQAYVEAQDLPHATVDAFLEAIDKGHSESLWLLARRLLDRIAYVGELFAGDGKTRLPGGAMGCTEFIVPAILPATTVSALFSFAWEA